MQPDPQYEDKVKEEEKYKESEFFLPYYPEPQVKCDRWEYEQILKKNIPSLVMAGGIPAFEWLCKLLSTAIRLSRRHDEDPEKPVRDYSYIWRPAIEEHEQNHKHDIKDALIDVVRDAAEQMIDRNQKNLILIGKILDNKESLPWPIFRRTAMHIMRVNKNATKSMISRYLAKKRYLTYPEYRHEYHLLAEAKFGMLSPKEQSSVLNWAMQGEVGRKKRLIEWYQENRQRDPSPEEIEDGVKSWLVEELAPFKQYLRGNLKKRYEDAVMSKGEADHPEFPSYSTSWVGPTSPKTSKELSEWSVQALLDYLRTWQPSGESMSDSRDGLADAIANAVGEKPEKYAGHCDQFYQLHPQLHPKYIRGFIEGFHGAARNNKYFPWAPVLSLSEWVVSQDREFSTEIIAQEIGDGREETSWAWTRKRIANLIEAGLKKTEFEIPFRFRTKVWAINEELTIDPEPKSDEKIFIDPATNSINTVRGQAMHTAMHYVLWVKRHIGEQVEGEDRTILNFGAMPEVSRLLRDRLDHRKEKTLTVHSVYAKWFPWLVAWDKEWAKRYKHKVFPGRPSLQEYWKTAWGTYIIYNRPYDNVFRILKRDYRKALRRLETIKVELAGASSVDESLAEHLMTFYWRGLIKRRSDGLINQFFDIACSDLRGHAIGFIGESIAHTDASIHSEIMQRFYDLWSWRLKTAVRADGHSWYKSELMAFGKWFGTQKLRPIEWALEQLLLVLKLVGRIDADEATVKYLSILANEYPMKVIECFRLMVLNEPDGYTMWLWKKHGKRLLSTIIAGANQDARDHAIDLVHRLVAMGHMEFRELLPSGRSQDFKRPI